MPDTDTDALWERYARAVLEWSPRRRIDLARPIGEAEREILRTYGLGLPKVPFTILTAENPQGQSLPASATPETALKHEARNIERMTTLRRLLSNQGLQPVSLTSASPDGVFRESQFAFPFGLTESRTLARELDQLAFFHWDGERFWLRSALLSYEPRALP